MQSVCKTGCNNDNKVLILKRITINVKTAYKMHTLFYW